MVSTRSPFDHELKLGRAGQHLNDIQVEVGKWLNGDHHSVRQERDPNDWLYMNFLATAEKPPVELLSLLIGDCLHNLRSALDLLAFALAVAYTKPLPDDVVENSEFPIFGDENRKGVLGSGAAMFRDNGRANIRGIDPAALTVIEGLQPYHRGNAYRTHPLWILHELDRVNKHRLLHTAVAHFSGFVFDTGKSYNWVIGQDNTIHRIYSFEGPIETDTPIARMAVSPADPLLKMHVEIQPSLDIAFAKGTLAAEFESVLKTLSGIYNYVLTDVLPPLTPFL